MKMGARPLELMPVDLSPAGVARSLLWPSAAMHAYGQYTEVRRRARRRTVAAGHAISCRRACNVRKGAHHGAVLKTMWKRRLVKVFAMVAGLCHREKGRPAAPTGL